MSENVEMFFYSKFSNMYLSKSLFSTGVLMAFLFSLLVFGLCLKFFSSVFQPSIIKKERLSSTVAGRVTAKLYTQHMHGTVFLELDSSTKITVNRKLFDSLEIGDSISKKATDTCVFVFRKASNFEQETLFHYFYDRASIEYGTCYCRKNDGVARYCHD